MNAHPGNAHVQIRSKARFATGWMYHVEVGNMRIWVDDAEMQQRYPHAVTFYNQTAKKRLAKQRATRGATHVSHEKRTQQSSKTIMAGIVTSLGKLTEEVT